MRLGYPTNRGRAGAEAHRKPPQIQGLRSPPEKKIASAAVITTRSNCALSRLITATETKNRARTRIRTTVVVVAINPRLRSRRGSASRHFPRAYGESGLHFDLL